MYINSGYTALVFHALRPKFIIVKDWVCLVTI